MGTHPGAQPEAIYLGKVRSLGEALVPLNTSPVASQGARGPVTDPSVLFFVSPQVFFGPQ